MAENTEIVEQKQTFSMALTERLDGVADALPKDFNKARFVQNAVALLNGNDTLIDYRNEYGDKGARQILAGLVKGAFLNLDFLSNEAYLVPYKSKLQFMPSYRGCVKLAQKYSIRPIKDIYAKVVRKGDEFQEKIVNGQPTIDFAPLPFNDGEIVGAFAVCQFADGGMQYDVMSLKELEHTRKASRMKSGVVWEQYTSEMYRKTVIRRLTKHIQLDFDNPEQYEYFNEGDQIELNDRKPKGASLNNILVEDNIVDVEQKGEEGN